MKKLFSSEFDSLVDWEIGWMGEDDVGNWGMGRWLSWTTLEQQKNIEWNKIFDKNFDSRKNIIIIFKPINIFHPIKYIIENLNIIFSISTTQDIVPISTTKNGNGEKEHNVYVCGTGV